MIVHDRTPSRIVQLEPHGDPFSRFGAVTLRVALMRPIAEAERSAALLRARGFEAVIAPVMEVHGTAAEPPDAGFDAALATSANAFAFLIPGARDWLRGLPLHVAGERTAAAARAWSAAEVAAVATCSAALHYSRRSAELSVALCAGAGIGDHWRATLHGCISEDAAEPLRSFAAKRIVTASGAQESLLIDALSSAAKSSL